MNEEENKTVEKYEDRENEILESVGKILPEIAETKKFQNETSSKRAELYDELTEINNNLYSYPEDEKSIWEYKRESVKTEIGKIEDKISKRKKSTELKIKNVRNDVKLELQKINKAIEHKRNELKLCEEKMKNKINKLNKEISTRDPLELDTEEMQSITEDLSQLQETTKSLNKVAFEYIKQRRSLTNILNNLSYEKIENLQELVDGRNKEKQFEEESKKIKDEIKEEAYGEKIKENSNEETFNKKTEEDSKTTQSGQDDKGQINNEVKSAKDIEDEEVIEGIRRLLNGDNSVPQSQSNEEKPVTQSQSTKEEDEKSLTKVKEKSFWEKLIEKAKKFFSKEEKALRKKNRALKRKKKDEDAVRKFVAEADADTIERSKRATEERRKKATEERNNFYGNLRRITPKYAAKSYKIPVQNETRKRKNRDSSELEK